jgi:hypothetical protein
MFGGQEEVFNKVEMKKTDEMIFQVCTIKGGPS